MDQMLLGILVEMGVQSPRDFLNESNAIEREVVECIRSIQNLILEKGEEAQDEVIPLYERMEELQSRFSIVLLRHNVNQELLTNKINDKLEEMGITPQSAIMQEQMNFPGFSLN